MNIGANMSIFLKTTKRNHTFFLIKHSKVELGQIKHADSLSIHIPLMKEKREPIGFSLRVMLCYAIIQVSILSRH